MKRSDGCWEFHGFHDRHGYGKWKQGKRASPRGAHCVAWELAHQACLVPGAVVRHACDNPGCVNPDHLTVGTQRDNIADRQQRARQARGSKNGRAKLTEEQVIEIRRSAKEGVKPSQLAHSFCISTYVISDILRGKTWKHLLTASEK